MGIQGIRVFSISDCLSCAHLLRGRCFCCRRGMMEVMLASVEGDDEDGVMIVMIVMTTTMMITRVAKSMVMAMTMVIAMTMVMAIMFRCLRRSLDGTLPAPVSGDRPAELAWPLSVGCHPSDVYERALFEIDERFVDFLDFLLEGPGAVGHRGDEVGVLDLCFHHLAGIKCLQLAVFFPGRPALLPRRNPSWRRGNRFARLSPPWWRRCPSRSRCYL